LRVNSHILSDVNPALTFFYDRHAPFPAASLGLKRGCTTSARNAPVSTKPHNQTPLE
jgi:hypothetical protein